MSVKQLQRCPRLELHFCQEHWLVSVSKGSCCDDDGVFLDRIQEFSPVELPSAWNVLGSMKLSSQTDPRFLLTAMVAFILVCLALPGLGDRLGTAQKIKNGVNSTLKSLKDR
jgi:hypothetical protein